MQMDEVTQQNAALVEEAAAAAESMQEQAQNLSRAVSQFRLVRAVSPAATRSMEVDRAAPVPVTRAPAGAAIRPARKVSGSDAAAADRAPAH